MCDLLLFSLSMGSNTMLSSLIISLNTYGYILYDENQISLTLLSNLSLSQKITSKLKSLPYTQIMGVNMLNFPNFLHLMGFHISQHLHMLQNTTAFSKHRHYHIVETSLTFLHHASIPLTFWLFAFTTTTHLINRLPKSNLSMVSSFEKLYGHPPNFQKLQVLVVNAIHVFLHPYTSYKLEPRSRACVFLDYSLT